MSKAGCKTSAMDRSSASSRATRATSITSSPRCRGPCRASSPTPESRNRPPPASFAGRDLRFGDDCGWRFVIHDLRLTIDDMKRPAACGFAPAFTYASSFSGFPSVMTMHLRSILSAATIVGIAFLAGCTTVRQSIPQRTNDEIWAAMLEVANNPDYNDSDLTKRWTVRENKVWADADEGRIEIYRRLERVLARPLSHALHEDREWRFEVTFNRAENPEDREVKFTSRGAGVPAHAKYEADRFFAQVWNDLGGKSAKMIAEEAAATQPSPVTDQHAPPMETGRR